MSKSTDFIYPVPIMLLHRTLHRSANFTFHNFLHTSSSGPVYPPVLFVALGNPSPQYDGTRHNVGQWAIEKMASEAWPHFAPFTNKQLGPLLTSHSPESTHTHVVLAKTTGTYMNISGPPVAKAWQKFKQQISRQNLGQEPCLVILHDELQVPLGKVQIRRRNTSARGHNGLRSIDKVMGNNYTKLAIGIGKAPSDNVADYVLSKFKPDERKVLETVTMPLLMDIMEQMAEGRHVHDKV
ncbi:hypothetical protein OXX59_005435 [Metschnikowia pulcherrima]